MLMRSKLFVPASRPELFAKAAASAADALSFDLEDAVVEARKDEAREHLARFLGAADAAGGKLVVVRVNAVGTSHFERDIEAVARPGVHLVNLPMVESADAVRHAADVLGRHETAHGITAPIRLLVNIETPKAMRSAASLATADPRVFGLQIGYADLIEPTGIDRRDEGALAYIRVAVRLAAAEAGIAAYDGAFADVADLAGYRAECDAAKRHGFAGKSCIHPSQIASANEAFMPTDGEIAHARKILAAAAAAQARGVGAILVDGQMVDAPFLIRARAVIAVADAAKSGSPA